MSNLLSVFSKILKNEKVIKNELTQVEINNLIKQNFSFCWYQFYKFLIPYCLRWKKLFGDLEFFSILATIVLNSGTQIDKKLQGIDSYLDGLDSQSEAPMDDDMSVEDIEYDDNLKEKLRFHKFI